jgi:hypothetical protein
VFTSIFSLLSLFWNKKFREELITYFPWYDTGHIENDASNNSSIVACVFVTAVTLLLSHCLATIGGSVPSHYLATIGGDTQTQTAMWSHKPSLFFQNKESRLKIESAYEITLLCVSVYPPFIASQWFGKNPLIIARQRLSRNVTAVVNTHATIEEFLDTSFTMWPVSYQGKQTISSSKNFLLILSSYLLLGLPRGLFL